MKNTQADYLTILTLLQAVEQFSLAHVKFMTVLNSAAAAHGIEFNVYPREMDCKEKAWLYVDKETANRRMALLAQVTREGAHGRSLNYRNAVPENVRHLLLGNTNNCYYRRDCSLSCLWTVRGRKG